MAEAVEAVDPQGRRLRLRVLDPADMLDLIEAAGENAGNRAWLRFAMLVCSVQSVDGVPMPFPRDPAGVKSLARRLGTEGLETARVALFGAETDAAPEGAAAESAALVGVAKN